MENEEINNNAQQPQQQPQKQGLSIASMVLGIVALVLFCLWFISIPCSILAIIVGVIGMKKGGKGMAIAGLVLGIVALVPAGLTIAGLATLSTSLSSLYY